ncbi:vesicular glutamate transporter 2-like [Planococcus citri]|uniref:vesicular glutamate transporter 2-like n=1 Tax=Planococcus citri TaxID=170843 RepID=UPI0031F83077
MEKHKFWFSKRFVVGILAFFGEMNIFALKANLNIAILDMTSNKTEIIEGNVTITRNPEFDWDSKTKGFVLGVSEYGAILAPLGGYLAMRYGGSTVITISNLIASILTVLTPLVIRFSLHLFIIIRVIEGITQVFRFVSFPELWSQWSPNRDRSKLMAISLTGLYAGPAIVYPVFGIVTRNYGWASTFYFSGGFSLVWSLIWVLLVPNSPAKDKWISREELNYIQQDPKRSRPKNILKIWKSMIFSKQVYALGVAKLVYNFGTTITVVCLPMFIQDITGSKIDKVGFYSALPTFINIFTTPLVGYILDYVNNKFHSINTKAYKISASSAFVLGGILLLTIAHLPNNFILLMTCLILFKTTLSVNQVVCTLNAIALAPKCSSVLASFLALFHMLGSVIGPLIIAFIVTGHSASQWNTSFIIFAIISFVGAIIFSIYGSAEPQPWSYSTDERNKKSDQSQDNQSTITYVT